MCVSLSLSTCPVTPGIFSISTVAVAGVRRLLLQCPHSHAPLTARSAVYLTLTRPLHTPFQSSANIPSCLPPPYLTTHTVISDTRSMTPHSFNPLFTIHAPFPSTYYHSRSFTPQQATTPSMLSSPSIHCSPYPLHLNPLVWTVRSIVPCLSI